MYLGGGDIYCSCIDRSDCLHDWFKDVFIVEIKRLEHKIRCSKY